MIIKLIKLNLEKKINPKTRNLTKKKKKKISEGPTLQNSSFVMFWSHLPMFTMHAAVSNTLGYTQTTQEQLCATSGPAPGRLRFRFSLCSNLGHAAYLWLQADLADKLPLHYTVGGWVVGGGSYVTRRGRQAGRPTTTTTTTAARATASSQSCDSQATAKLSQQPGSQSRRRLWCSGEKSCAGMCQI